MADYTPIPIVGTPKATPPLVMPAIRLPRQTWQRDPGVSEFIDHLNQPALLKIKKIPERWAMLDKSDVGEIGKILGRCRGEFQFAARNFFWITTKDRGDKLFSLWEAQELILEYWLRLKLRGVAQRLQIIKSRQLGCSTVIEALIAWRTMFFNNVMAFVIADTAERAAKLFGIMQYIYDRIPWWLKPMIASREYKDGLLFQNPEESEREQNPGLNSQIVVNYATKLSGIGQGYSVNCCHCSEYPSYDPRKAREIIEEDLGNALADNAETFAFLEGTAKGAGTFAHKLWIKNVNLGEDAQWVPVFLPSFFDMGHRLPVQEGWTPDQAEIELRERAAKDWLRCNNQECRQYHERYFCGRDRETEQCPTCKTGLLDTHIVSDEFLAWMAHQRKNTQDDLESQKALQQEQCCTAEAAFVASGHKTFSDQAQNWAHKHIEEPTMGMIDKAIRFHGCCMVKKRQAAIPGEFWYACFQPDCDANHQFDKSPIAVYRWPQRGARYVIGVDVSEGLGGDNNYSVASVLRVDNIHEPDEQVAVFRSNSIDRLGLAEIVIWLGYWYNTALIAVESNRYDTVANAVQNTYLYPNCYRSTLASGNISNKLGWETTEKSKGALYDTMYRWLEYKQLIIHSRNLAEEMKTFKRHDSLKGGGRGTYSAAKGFSDDELMATAIGLFVAHKGDYDENLGYVVMRAELSLENALWHMQCLACNTRWPANSLQGTGNCPRCRSLQITGTKNANYIAPLKEDPQLDLMQVEAEPPQEPPDYDML